jgi:aryl-alcohol dehydrogenase-like predicted oxidoreductase
MKLNRRQFLTTTIASAGSLAFARTFPAAEAVKARSTDPFQMVPLGRTGSSVSLIGAGTGMRAGNRQSNMTRLGKEKFEALLRYEFEQGVRYFDLADTYGSHPYVASALKSLPRDQHFFCSKMWVRSGGIPEPERPDANIVVDRFRKELNTDYIDLVLLHCMTDPNWTDQQKRQMDLLAELKSKKIIRSHGVSVHTLEAMQAAAASPWVDSVHVRINAFGDSMDRKDPAEVVPVIKQLRAAGKGVVGMKLIGEGRYRNTPEKIDESLRYVFGQDCVDTMVVGFEKPEELDDFAKRVKAALTASAGKA